MRGNGPDDRLHARRLRQGVAAIAPIDGQFWASNKPTELDDASYFVIQGGMEDQALVGANNGIVLAQMAGSEGELLIIGDQGGIISALSINGGAGTARLRLQHGQSEYRLATPANLPIPLSGSLTLLQEGPGSTVLQGSYTHTGGTAVFGGDLILRGANLAHPGAAMVVAQGTSDIAALRVQEAAQLATGTLFVGFVDGAFGDVTVIGGSSWNANALVVGVQSAGFLTIGGNSQVKAGAVVIGSNLSAARQAEVALNGAGSALNVSTSMQVGGSGAGQGRLWLSTGASVNVSGNATVGGTGGAADELRLGTSTHLDVGGAVTIRGNASIQVTVEQLGHGRVSAGSAHIEAGAALEVVTFGPQQPPGTEFEILSTDSGITGAFSSVDLPTDLELATHPNRLVVRVAAPRPDELFKDRFQNP